ncbi:haloacid dehalogenase-like hydrolase [Arenibacter sp. BSSL-BM3]|uniref:Haloacid dehalogenase-like hydrolase n=1 Tax=Arenibacter arenosicollis TaxID=2762274 RepID=A0ABR7QRY2_9FLAO|nr:HAD family hydrolase [Arenibacter arenosicollis]MBC8769834.1 haloacid dehalogenase-like hydrolase [Arenibacter arenosicollis]
MSLEKEIYLFDFDGTITNKDSFIHFLTYSKSWFQLFSGFLYIFPFVILMKLNLYSNEKAKTKLFSFHFKGMDVFQFDRLCLDYSQNELPEIIRASFLDYLKEVKKENKDLTIVVVSASFKSYLKHWTKFMDFDLVCTELEHKNHVLTGNFATKNCYGIEKVNRIREKYSLSEFNKISVFGDSEGDKEMLLLGNKRFYKYFK